MAMGQQKKGRAPVLEKGRSTRRQSDGSSAYTTLEEKELTACRNELHAAGSYADLAGGFTSARM